MIPPIPSRKPEMGGTSILGSIWDAASNTFGRIADFRMSLWEQEQIADLRKKEAEAKAAQQKQYAGSSLDRFIPTMPEFVNSNGMPTQTAYLGMALIAGAVFLLARD